MHIAHVCHLENACFVVTNSINNTMAHIFIVHNVFPIVITGTSDYFILFYNYL